MKKLFTTGLMLSLFSASLFATDVIGYSDGTVGKPTIFRTATEHTGLSVRIPAEKIRMLAGHKINSLEIAVGSKKAKDGKISLFVSQSLDGEPEMAETLQIGKANSWIRYDFSEPYTITGEETDLYIGYTLEIPKTYMALSADMSAQMKGVTFALYEDEWRDVCDMEVGQGNIRAVLDSDPEITDLLFKPLNLNEYYKEGTAYSFSGELFNFGTKNVDNFKINLQIGASQPQQYDISETIEPGKSYVFNIPDYTATESGNLDVKLEIEEVNGAADNDPSDNKEETNVFFYPYDMERAILLENFTGQECSNCPAGHRTIETVVEDWNKNEDNPEIIEVSHHAGYYPDIFTMKEDVEYTSLYSGSTYAPAVMINRMRNSSENAPVFNVSQALLTNALEYVSKAKPYVALSLESDFDPSSRKLDVRVKARTFDEIPENIRTINVMLCQDNLIASQSGMGSSYNHSHVFRGTLTGNAWGVQMPFEPGTVEEYEVSYVIPETIYSSYYENDKHNDDYEITAIPDDMYIVAYVGTFDDDNINKRYILNCAKVRLGEDKVQQGFSGIDSVTQNANKPTVRIADGRVYVNTECRAIEVYDLSGSRIPDGSLHKGIYIVRVITETGDVAVSKVIAR